MGYITFHNKALDFSHKLLITNSLWPFAGHFFNRSKFVFSFIEF